VFTELTGCIDSGDPALESILADEESQGLAG
jgi:hypothetical protein